MVFNSLEYGVFLPLVVLLHKMAPARWRAGLLLVASYAFYAAWNPLYLPLIVGMTAANWLIGLALEAQPVHGRRRTILLIVGIAANLGVLGCFKYLLFAIDSTTRALTLVHLTPDLPRIALLLPLGISFFTFEFIHYLVDVYRGGPAIRSTIKFALFAAFFPTQIAGPIKRYEQFVPQIDRPVPLDWLRLGDGASMIVRGLFKKMALADNLAPIAAAGFTQTTQSGIGPVDAWLTTIAFAFQIYFDFSGYTDIGRGSAVLLGYFVPENFRRPYLSTNVAEFWHRWHISLSTWLRDYLYVPLGGNRAHRQRNLMLTMALGGLWHGASTTYIIWGVLHGTYLCLYRAVIARRHTTARGAAPHVRVPKTVLAWALTFALVCVGWVFFRSTNTSHALVMVLSMLGVFGGQPALLANTQRVVVIAIAVGTLATELMVETCFRLPLPVGPIPRLLPSVGLRPAAYVALLSLAVVLQPSDAPRFIYFQF
jgi:alginate O-acetyltransferase complex protein AlgI